jgi:hypothetical protein
MQMDNRIVVDNLPLPKTEFVPCTFQVGSSNNGKPPTKPTIPARTALPILEMASPTVAYLGVKHPRVLQPPVHNTERMLFRNVEG